MIPHLYEKGYSGNEHKVIRGIGLVNCVYSLSHKDEVQ